jgi:hypothetical protein
MTHKPFQYFVDIRKIIYVIPHISTFFNSMLNGKKKLTDLGYKCATTASFKVAYVA